MACLGSNLKHEDNERKMNGDNENDVLTKKLEIGKKVILWHKKYNEKKFNDIKKSTCFGTLNKSI